jgi:hypothetical protein
MMGTRPFAHGWAEPFEWPPAMSDVAVDMALDVLPDVSPGGTPGGTELVATPASRESIDGAAPVRTPLGVLLPGEERRLRGRPCERYVLHAPHPLSDSHILVANAKWDTLVLAGAPPPKLPPPVVVWEELVNDTNFLELLQDAQRDPKGVAAREVVKRVLTFINLSSSSIPWGAWPGGGCVLGRSARG